MKISRTEQFQSDLLCFSTGSRPKGTVTSLLVYLRQDVHGCIASFIGSITATTRVTIDGVADLIIGEQSVALDFSGIDAIDTSGAEAVAVLVRSVQDRGAHLRITQPRVGTVASLREQAHLGPG
jgi:anti-anti-sigma regulatory factor